MKRLLPYLIVVLLLVSCSKKVGIIEPPFTFDKSLLQIDSLMQRDPDSALVILLDKSCLVPTGCDELSRNGKACLAAADVNDDYRSLLLSDALYKTGNAQLNRYRCETYGRTSLQNAVRYFDSLYAENPRNDDLAVLSARAHYMNGVGFYENDSVVEACKEYLHTLKIMEEHFEDKELVGYKAKFMALTYNRLVDLFSNQFMMEQAIYCGQRSLFFCKIEPTSIYGIPNSLSKLGKLYDISRQTDSAYYYYNEALISLPDTNNLIYRDLASSIAVLSYESGNGLPSVLRQLFQVANQADSYDERITRFFTIGSLYYEEKIYDSAAKYLNLVYEHGGLNIRKLQAADFLMSIFLIKNDTLAAHIYANYLAQNAVSKYDKSFDSSILNEMFKNYMSKKTHELQKRNKSRIITVIILVVVLVIISFVYILTHSANKINKTNNEHRRVIYTERKARYREKSKMLDTIKQQKTKIDKLEKELGQKRHEAITSIEAFMNEPICKQILDVVSEHNFKSKVDYKIYEEYALSKSQIMLLRDAVDRHYDNFTQTLNKTYPQLTTDDINYCCLYLLGLKDADISALIQKNYSVITRRRHKFEDLSIMDKIHAMDCNTII